MTQLQIYGGLLIIALGMSVLNFAPSTPFSYPLGFALLAIGFIILLWPALSKEHQQDDVDSDLD
ncbi:hypothetical protein DYI20_04390 [Auritidibacter ignavus]|uniref:Uncharacterized protein n=2 Tax=Micrococcaceae TaxID=1268 RepID=A0AAJ6AGK5_9MICC|nr:MULTISPECIES: hypothetical protein [Auritidibacter]PXA78298.1 hypothetical protein DCC24_01030 [Auritidibacter sp. NML100628]PXA79643.1 hypothetical protein DCC26_05230 [Auritidibacter sp. NML120779]AXR74860.1 hypothetical protein DCC27_011680 [Auritidibacter sp. NML130574]PXA81064.1 hypothetical protein DCC25_04280 [Auritidibacter sp. NML120636]RMX23542.1 hypothetical protein DYI20_04390 [Auritidibacter ignavus]